MVADKTGTAPVPAAPGQTPRAIQGGWGTGIPKNIDPALKPAAWRALTWITQQARQPLRHREVPDRRQPRFRPSRIRTLVAEYPYLPDSLKAIENAETIPTSRVDEFFQLNDAMNIEFNAALTGAQDAETACAEGAGAVGGHPPQGRPPRLMIRRSGGKSGRGPAA